MTTNLAMQERVLRTTFWTLLVLLSFLALYEFAVENYGILLFVPNQPVPKWHMLIEAHLAGFLSLIVALPLAAITIVNADRKPSQRWLGFSVLGLWFIYYVAPRY